MSRPIALGIDFGTTNSAVSVAFEDGAEVIPVDRLGGAALPSIVYVDSTGQRLAGTDAVEQFVVVGPRQSRLMSSLKSFLAEPSLASGTKATWGEHFTVPDLAAIILRQLKRAGDSHAGTDMRRVVLGHPVCFVGAEGPEFETRQRLAMDRLHEAAELAGFQEIEFLDEPTAALIPEDLPEGTVVSLDFGGGTFDVSVIEFTPEAGDVLAIQGAAVGGELFDALLFDAKATSPLGLDGQLHTNGKVLPVPAKLRQMRTLNGILRMVSDDSTWSTLTNCSRMVGGERLRVVEEILAGGHAYAFYRAVEGAKIGLADADRVELAFKRPRIDIDVPVTRVELDAILKAHLDIVDGQIDRALAQAGVDAQAVDRVVRTGGSSRLASFVDRLRSRFEDDRIVEREAYTTVALGLGMHALEVWG